MSLNLNHQKPLNDSPDAAQADHNPGGVSGLFQAAYNSAGGRELRLVAGSLDGALHESFNKQTGLQVAGSLLIGAGLGFLGRSGRFGMVAAKTAGTVFGIQFFNGLMDQGRWKEAGSAMSDAWAGGANMAYDTSVMKNSFGRFAVDTGLMLGSGMLGGALGHADYSGVPARIAEFRGRLGDLKGSFMSSAPAEPALARIPDTYESGRLRTDLVDPKVALKAAKREARGSSAGRTYSFNELAQLKQDILTASDTVAPQLEAQTRETNQRMQAQKAEVDAIQKELTEQQSTLDAVKALSAEKQAVMNARASLQELTQKESGIPGKEAELAALEARLADLQKAQQEAKTTKKGKGGGAKAADKGAGEKDAEKKGPAKQIDALKEQKSELVREIKRIKLDTDRSNPDSPISRAPGILSQADADLEQAGYNREARIQELEAVVTATEARLQTAQSTYADLAKELESTMGQYHSRLEELQSKHAKDHEKRNKADRRSQAEALRQKAEAAKRQEVLDQSALQFMRSQHPELVAAMEEAVDGRLLPKPAAPASGVSDSSSEQPVEPSSATSAAPRVLRVGLADRSRLSPALQAELSQRDYDFAAAFKPAVNSSSDAASRQPAELKPTSSPVDASVATTQRPGDSPAPKGPAKPEVEVHTKETSVEKPPVEAKPPEVLALAETTRTLSEAEKLVKTMADHRRAEYQSEKAERHIADIEKGRAKFKSESDKTTALNEANARQQDAKRELAKLSKPQYRRTMASVLDFVKASRRYLGTVADTVKKDLIAQSSDNIAQTLLTPPDGMYNAFLGIKGEPSLPRQKPSDMSHEARLEQIEQHLSRRIAEMDAKHEKDTERFKQIPLVADLLSQMDSGQISPDAMVAFFEKGKLVQNPGRNGGTHQITIDVGRYLKGDGGLGRFAGHEPEGAIILDRQKGPNGEWEQYRDDKGVWRDRKAVTASVGVIPEGIETGTSWGKVFQSYMRDPLPKPANTGAKAPGPALDFSPSGDGPTESFAPPVSPATAPEESTIPAINEGAVETN